MKFDEYDRPLLTAVRESETRTTIGLGEGYGLQATFTPDRDAFRLAAVGPGGARVLLNRGRADLPAESRLELLRAMARTLELPPATVRDVA